MNKIFEKQKGAALMIFLIFFLIGSTALTFSLARTIYSDTIAYQLLSHSAQSYFAADSGTEDLAYRYIAGLAVNTSETIVVGTAVATTTTVFDSLNSKYDIVSVGMDNNAYRSSSMELYSGIGASFNFGVQSGNGGFTLTNGSSVQGNVFSNGTIEKTGGGNATIYGDAISGGPTGLIKDVIATGTVRANRIETSHIYEDAYFMTESANTVDGVRYPGSPDQGTTTMPITDDEIEAIKQDILDSGTVIASTSPECAGGEYYTDDDLTLGFVKIECDFRMKKKGSATVLTLTGSIWVEGNVTFEGGPDVVVDAGVGNRTVPFIADKESDRSNSSSIVVQTGTTFTGSGTSKSYVLLISQNNDAENGLPAAAISLAQSSSGDLLTYAAHGLITMANSISLKEVTGYKIHLGNSAEVIYESGLVNTLFTSGPGGGYTIGGWSETY